MDFLLAFESLERNGKLRCFQVANDRDPVTLSPPQGAFNPFHALLCQRRRFRHVGLRLKLRELGYIIMYNPKPRSYLGILCCDSIHLSRTWLIILILVLLILVSLSLFYVYIAVPLIVLCACIALCTSRMHHTQLKYIRRLEYNKETLTELYLDELNKERWERSPYRFPVLRTHGECRKLLCCNRAKRTKNEEDLEPMM